MNARVTSSADTSRAASRPLNSAIVAWYNASLME
jgi:hypothetical protein